jgi:hypothetical protein
MLFPKNNLFDKVYFTVLYFNCLKHPPTSFEVWRNFLDFSEETKQVDFFEIAMILEKLKREGRIEIESGFWVLKENKKTAEERAINSKVSLMKLRRIKNRINFIKFLPFIRGVFISGTLAFQTASKKSDWDVLVIIKKDRIWLGRLILTLFLFVTKQKRTKIKIKNRFCLNHFLTENNLIPESRNDYTACEHSFIFPIFGIKIFQKFALLNWNWVRRSMPNFEIINDQENSFLVDERWSKKTQKIFEKTLEAFNLAGFLNNICKKWMTKRIENNPDTFKKGAVVIFNDGELAFWPEFKRMSNFVK